VKGWDTRPAEIGALIRKTTGKSDICLRMLRYDHRRSTRGGGIIGTNARRSQETHTGLKASQRKLRAAQDILLDQGKSKKLPLKVTENGLTIPDIPCARGLDRPIHLQNAGIRNAWRRDYGSMAG